MVFGVDGVINTIKNNYLQWFLSRTSKSKMINLLAVILFTLFGFLNPDPICIHMIGDSTMSVKDTNAYPETGWGMPFSIFFDETVKVINHAKNGRSTRTFIEEGRWDVVMKDLSEGDFVLIQFGHNDEVQTKKSATKPDEFRANLEKYISDSRGKGATPILLTPIARRKYDESGKLVDTHQEFANIVRETAKSNKVYLIDLDLISRELLTKLGVEQSKMLYNHIASDIHPNYPAGIEDNTHFSEYGARVMAQLAFAELKKFDLELNNRVTKGR